MLPMYRLGLMIGSGFSLGNEDDTWLEITRKTSRVGRQWHPLKSCPDFLSTETGGGGDCGFHSIGFSLGMPMMEVRRELASMVTHKNVDALLHYWEEVYPVATWNKDAIRKGDRVRNLQDVIRTQGSKYLLDDVGLQLLTLHRGLQVGFMVFNSDGTLYHHLYINKHTRRVIMLLHLPGHWQSVGMAKGQHEVQLDFHPFRSLPHPFLAQVLESIGVKDLKKEFGLWEPGLLLEEKKQKQTTAEAQVKP